MRRSKPLIVLGVLLSLIVTGCSDSGGFSISPGDYETEEPQNDQKHGDDEQTDGKHGGGGGTESEKNPDGNDPVDPVISGVDHQDETPQVDLGNQIVNFALNFVKVGEDNYVYITVEEDPFDNKYDYSYYTINNAKLDEEKEIVKETIDDKEVYKLYLGEVDSKTYTIQFFNKSGKQYGKSEIEVQVHVVRKSFVNNLFGIVKIKFVSLGLNIANKFVKIADTIRRWFKGGGLTINK